MFRPKIHATTTFRGLSVNKVTRLTLAVAVSICASIPMFAQSTNSGDIRGTVTDKSGAVVPGATVSVEDIDKNVTKTFTTNGNGLYDTGSIVADHYIVTFSKTGFSTVVRGPITVEVGQLGLNAELAVGATTQRVVVNTNVPLLQTETGAQESTFTATSLEQLPLVAGAGGGNNGGADPTWESFTILMPGAASTSQMNDSMGAPGIQVAINGNLPYSDVLADGATATLPQSQNASLGGYILETVAELKVESSSFSAQYGVGGVVYNQISKGGSSQYHGEGYEFFQNDALNATPALTKKKPVQRFDNYGFNIGGPVLKKKMFVFFDFDKTYDNGGSSTNTNSVPTLKERTGDFSELGTAPADLIYDPATTVVDVNGNVTRQSFLAETGKNAIPATSIGGSSVINPVAAKIGAYYPLPTNNQLTNNFVSNVPTLSPLTRYFGRLDYDITSKNRLTATDFQNDNPATDPGFGQCPIGCAANDIENNNAQISDVWTIRPKLINEARIGFTDQLNFFQMDTVGKGYPTKLGWTSNKADDFPIINSATQSWLQLGSGGAGLAVNAIYKEFAYDPSDVVTLIKGRHVLHFGGELLMNQANSTNWGNLDAGQFNFDGRYTQNYVPPTPPATKGSEEGGNSYADFLLGYANNWQAQVTPEESGRLKLPMLFAQDDIQVRPNLTVNVGLRWQGMTGWTDTKGNEATYDPTLINATTGLPGAMWYGTTKAGGRSRIMAPVWNNFLPRLGFSYQPTSNTVIRGGVGLFGYTWSTDTYANGEGSFLGSRGNEQDSTNGAFPVTILSDSGNTNYQIVNGVVKGAAINTLYTPPSTSNDAKNGQGVSYQQYHTPVAKIWQYNVQVQRELGNDLVAELAYVGSHGFNLVYPTDLNEVPAAKLGPNDSGSRPNPAFGNINGDINTGISNYNSLQAVLEKRMSDGLSFNVNYVLSSFKDDQSSGGWGSHGGAQPWQINIPSANYGPSDFDIRNALKGQVVYQLPIGKGRRFLNNNWIVDEVIGGWQLSSTLVVESGTPFTVNMGTDNSGSLAGNNFKWFPDKTGISPYGAGTKTVSQWYNPAAFTSPASYTYGNAGRNTLVGPRYSDVSLAAAKTFPIWKSVAAYISASADNVLNHASYSQPNVQANFNGTPIVGAAQITGVTNGGRTMMLAGKLIF